MMHVTGFFAGLLALLFIALSFNVIRSRYGLKLLIGDGGDATLMRRMRAHANFAEYVPLALLLMGINELNGQSAQLLTWFGWILVIGRISHAYSLLVMEVKHPRFFYFRSIGMVSTFTVIGWLAYLCISHA